jgi:hypothetical protein
MEQKADEMFLMGESEGTVDCNRHLVKEKVDKIPKWVRQKVDCYHQLVKQKVDKVPKWVRQKVDCYHQLVKQKYYTKSPNG